jgi:hypothetical protein
MTRGQRPRAHRRGIPLALCQHAKSPLTRYPGTVDGDLGAVAMGEVSELPPVYGRRSVRPGVVDAPAVGGDGSGQWGDMRSHPSVGASGLSPKCPK